MDIPFYYDPMIAKLVCHAGDRSAAIARTIRAIDEYNVVGVQTTLGFCRFVMTHEAFTSGKFDTRFVERYFTPAALQPALSAEEEELAAALAAEYLSKQEAVPENHTGEKNISRWKLARL
jgi:acetyl/propionyl-CoA carboxylase alpha subunit